MKSNFSYYIYLDRHFTAVLRCCVLQTFCIFQAGRTALMRAIENGKSSKFIDQMIRRKFGQTLLDRNKASIVDIGGHFQVS